MLIKAVTDLTDWIFPSSVVVCMVDALWSLAQFIHTVYSAVVKKLRFAVECEDVADVCSIYFDAYLLIVLLNMIYKLRYMFTVLTAFFSVFFCYIASSSTVSLQGHKFHYKMQICICTSVNFLSL